MGTKHGKSGLKRTTPISGCCGSAISDTAAVWGFGPICRMSRDSGGGDICPPKLTSGDIR